MKFILIAAFLFVQAFALPVEDEPAFDLLMDEFDETDECRALLTGEVSRIARCLSSRKPLVQNIQKFCKGFSFREFNPIYISL